MANSLSALAKFLVILLGVHLMLTSFTDRAQPAVPRCGERQAFRSAISKIRAMSEPIASARDQEPELGIETIVRDLDRSAGIAREALSRDPLRAPWQFLIGAWITSLALTTLYVPALRIGSPAQNRTAPKWAILLAAIGFCGCVLSFFTCPPMEPSYREEIAMKDLAQRFRDFCHSYEEIPNPVREDNDLNLYEPLIEEAQVQMAALPSTMRIDPIAAPWIFTLSNLCLLTAVLISTIAEKGQARYRNRALPDSLRSSREAPEATKP